MVKSAPELITLQQLAARLGLSRSTVYRLMAEDASFPQPLKLALRRNSFVATEVDAYVAARIAARDGGRERAHAPAGP